MKQKNTGNGVFLDVTILGFAGDLRGIHQVIFRMVEILAKTPRFKGTSFVAAPGTFKKYLEPIGVSRDQVVEMSPVPGIGRYERFHGLFSTIRYRKLLKRNPKLIIHPELRTVVRCSVPQALCYHDFIELEPDSTESRKWSRRLYYRYKAKIASRVEYKMTNSDHTREKALAFFPSMDTAKLKVVHLGVREALTIASIEKTANFSPINFLYVGSYQPRKNIAALLSHLQEVVGSHDVVLHLAGRIAPDIRKELDSIAQSAGVRSKIRWHGLVTDAELSQLYAACHILLFPSLKEGFGLPLVEAMGNGLVVFGFRNSAIPEIVGDAGILEANNDFAAWGRALDDLIQEPESYTKYSNRARERAQYFSPESAKKRLTDWFESIFQSSGISIPEGVQ